MGVPRLFTDDTYRARILANVRDPVLLAFWRNEWDSYELRFRTDETPNLDHGLDGLAERIEVLPDRVLLYTSDGDAAVAALHGRGLRPESSLVRRGTLEDVFLRLTGRRLGDG